MALSSDYMTPAQAAIELRVHHATVRKWIATGQLRAYRVGGRIRIRKSDVRRFVVPAVTAPQPESVAV